MTACADKVAYLSEYLATNAVTLHRFVHPDCTDVRAYLCPHRAPDEPRHWHVGHQHKEAGARCKAEEPRRPKWPKSRLYKTRKTRDRPRAQGAA